MPVYGQLIIAVRHRWLMTRYPKTDSVCHLSECKYTLVQHMKGIKLSVIKMSSSGTKSANGSVKTESKL